MNAMLSVMHVLLSWNLFPWHFMRMSQPLDIAMVNDLCVYHSFRIFHVKVFLTLHFIAVLNSGEVCEAQGRPKYTRWMWY